jgi:mRNA interferase YafQ
MTPVFHSTAFRKDLRLANKRGKDLGKLRRVIEQLARGEPLPQGLRDHPLEGDWVGHRECHLEPDWLLIHQVDEAAGLIRLERTGTHSDLFR